MSHRSFEGEHAFQAPTTYGHPEPVSPFLRPVRSDSSEALFDETRSGVSNGLDIAPVLLHPVMHERAARLGRTAGGSARWSDSGFFSFAVPLLLLMITLGTVKAHDRYLLLTSPLRWDLPGVDAPVRPGPEVVGPKLDAMTALLQSQSLDPIP